MVILICQSPVGAESRYGNLLQLHVILKWSLTIAFIRNSDVRNTLNETIGFCVRSLEDDNIKWQR
jgi:hypothetical protein